jgi:hypothetical protein
MTNHSGRSKILLYHVKFWSIVQHLLCNFLEIDYNLFDRAKFDAKDGSIFFSSRFEIWHDFFFVNCNKSPNIESPGIATHKSSKPKHCNSYYIEDICDKRFVDQVFAYMHHMCLSRTYYYCLYITISFLKVSNSNFVIEMLCLKLFANDNFQNHLREH